MDQAKQAFKATEIATDKRILALSWKIATEPTLYWELAPNPYSKRALQRISERFPEASTADITRAVVIAEPEGSYDRNFRLLETAQQEKELNKQIAIATEINKRLTEYCKKYAGEFNRHSSEIIYNSLSIAIFGTNDLREIEEKYAQNQRQYFKLLIVNFIEDDDSASKIEVFHKRATLARRRTFKVTFAALSLIVLFYLANGIYTKHVNQGNAQDTTQYPETKEHVLSIEVKNESEGFPVRLKIPRINVDAAIGYVSVTSKGAMGVPNNTVDVGWFGLGPRPGDKGSAVIAGHVDGKNGEAGVFANLYKIKKGDKLYIEDNRKTLLTFVVREKRTYDPGYAEDVFSRNDNAHLNLITCDGIWDGSRKSYSKRLVVFADIIK